MMNAEIQSQLIHEVSELPIAKQRQVLKFAKSLKDTAAVTDSEQDRHPSLGVPGNDLRKFAGCLPKEDAEEMMRLVDEGCEDIDHESWK